MTEQDAIFVISGAGKLERVPHRAYASEDLLQQLIEDHPSILAGDQINPDNPPRWFLVSREAGIPDATEGSDRWAVDHLLLDQWARPTFVEVKRSSDTRIRREVVGQMLDYAANASAYWPADRIRALAAQSAGGVEDLDRVLTDFLGEDAPEADEDTVEAFWSEVHRRLTNGEVRLLFVADEIPTELRRVIEFLNDHMPAVEVLGIEIRQYQGNDLKALVPRVVGQTEYARQTKAAAKRRQKLTATEFLELCPPHARQFFDQLLAEAASRHLTVAWGQTGFSLRVPRRSGEMVTLFYGLAPGAYGSSEARLQPYFSYLGPEDDTDQLRARLLAAAPFQERGAATLDLAIEDEEVAAAAEKSLGILWEAAEAVRLSTSQQGGENVPGADTR